MKKIIMFLVLVISIVSIGLTIYYFSIDNEVISIRSSYLVLDRQESIQTSELLNFKNKSEMTRFEYLSSNNQVLEFNSEDKSFVAKSAGTCDIVINTSNRLYSKLSITVRVCDGSSTSPYQVNSESKLKKIGNDPNYPLDAHYVLASDIVLSPITDGEGNLLDGTWTPIENFSGVFDGAFHTIYGMKITDSTLGNGKNAGFMGSIINKTENGDNVTMSTPNSTSAILSTGVVKNLILRDVEIDVSRAENIGSIVALNNSEVHTSIAYGSIATSKDGSVIGGVVGSSIYSEVRPIIDRCGFEGGIKINDDISCVVGGVAGLNKSGTISECYMVTGASTNSIENGNSNFGGIVGKNEGNAEKAKVYDNFFYITAKHEGEDETSNTNFSNFAGVIYENTNTVNPNNVLGNYYGGDEALENIYSVKGGATVNARFNSYLSKEDFAGQSISDTKFISYIDTQEVKKTWAFDTVWNFSQNYPILNIHSASGSIYVEDIDIIPDTEISNANEFLDAILGLRSYESKIFFITASEIDLEGKVIGSTQYPIPDTFLNLSNNEIGSLVSINGTTIKNVTIANNVAGADVGLSRLMPKGVYVSGLTFDNVNIIGQRGNFVGVLAGSSEGANVQNVELKNVTCQIDGTCFGGLFGLYRYTNGHAIQSVSAYNISCEDNRFIFAGAIVGYNYGNIIGSNNYSTVNIAKLSGNYTGGVTGINKGNSSVSNYIVNNVSFNQALTGNTSEGKIYSGEANASGSGDLFLGGVTGRNYGIISNVYANSRITAYAYDSSLSAHAYSVYAGGIAGINQSKISRAYVSSTNINVIKNGNVFVGGLVGFNYGSGTISQSVVDSNTTLEADTTVTVAPTDGNQFEYAGLSMVGGLVGYDYYTDLDYSIYQCVSRASSIKGFYSAGLVAIEFGKMLECECGDLTKTDGGVSVTGFMSAGLSVLAKGGYIKDCYTICTLNTVAHSGTYHNITSVAGRRVSGTAGLILIADANATIRGNYSIANFASSNTGVSFAGFGYSNNANITGNIFVNAGNKPTTAGNRLTDSELRGSDNYAKFMSNIGSEDNRVWSTEYGYPVIKAIDERNNDRVTPNYLG